MALILIKVLFPSISTFETPPSEVLCGAGGGLYQGESGDPHCSDIHGAPQELYRAPFLGSGYYVSTVGRDEAVIREYIRTHEAEDRRLDQMDLW